VSTEPRPLPEGIEVTDDYDVLLHVGGWLTTLYGNVNRADVEEIVHHVAAAVAEQCAQECDRLANNYGSEKRDFAEAIRALFPKP
jgi:hypothetical protein